MKATFLLFSLMVSCVGLTHETAYAACPQTSPESTGNVASANAHDLDHAAPVGNGEHERDARPSDDQPARYHVSDTKKPLRRASLTTAKHPEPLRNQERFARGNARNFQQRGLGKIVDAGEGSSIRDEKVASVLTLRRPSVVQPVVPSRSIARFRNATPVAIGGLANSEGKKIGAISGSRIRKP